MPPMRRNNIPLKKEKTDFKALGKVFKFAKPYYVALIFAIIFAALGSVASIIGPEKITKLVNIITDGIGVGIDYGAFLEICIFLVCLYSAGALFSYLQQFIMAEVTQKTSKRLRTSIDKKINKLPLSYFDRTTKGDILSRITNDVDTIAESLGATVANIVSSSVLFVGVIVKMFMSNWILALTTIVSSSLGFVFMGLILSKSQKYFTKVQNYIGDLEGHVEESFSNYRVVKSYNGLKAEKEKFNRDNKNIRETGWKARFLAELMPPIMGFVGDLSYLLIFVVGVSLIVSGSSVVTIGTLIGFIVYAKLFSQPLRTIAQSMSSIQQASAASKRVFGILEEPELPEERKRTSPLAEVNGAVEFSHVKFGYNKEKIVINDFSAKIKPGQKVAIVGPTGAGKTTMVNLLMRFYEMNEGDILIDDKSIKSMTRQDVHDLFDMILQDTWLFDGTLRENLVYNALNISDEKLDEVCEAVGLKHFVKSLPKGYDTILDESSSLSEGQRQQITIARAMIKDSPLLILDEATSNVDTRTELVIQEAMDKLTQGRTSFVIAHRLSTIRNADLILVMKDGDIIETGNHQELLNKNGFYAELYRSQFEEIG